MPFDSVSFLKTVPHEPGVYQMFDAKGTILYIGKAKDLHKRLKSYFNKAQDTKTQRLVSLINSIEFTLVQSEVEALVLEHNLIKTHKPRYNILLKDDKSYPYIHITTHQTYPRMDIFRGTKTKQGKFFGPYPSAYAARISLHLMQKLFKVRQCRDTFFKHRTRPCLQYQIKRCTAPCVGYIDPKDYKDDVNNVVAFLEGRATDVIDALVKKMDTASSEQAYEQAAMYRDEIKTLRYLSQQQYVNRGYGFADVCVCLSDAGFGVVTQIFIRQGEVLGHKHHFFQESLSESDEAMLSEFIGQYYLVKDRHEVPAEIIVNMPLKHKAAMESALEAQTHKKVKITSRMQKNKQQWLDMALRNANEALNRHVTSQGMLQTRFDALAQWLGVESLNRLECFDVSHTQGDETVASCVVFDKEGPLNKDYRRFNIKGVTGGDDYAAMAQALIRHYQKRKSSDAVMPDLVIIDGGKGQLHVAMDAMAEMQLSDLPLLGVSKGRARKPGEEQLWRPGVESVRLPADSPALHLIQAIRDEAHRFAITGHRKRRGKKLGASPLDEIEGIGPKRRAALLKQFGGWQGLKAASLEQLAQTKGMSATLAKAVYNAIHEKDN